MLQCVHPRAVAPELITPGDTEANKILNAKYVLTIARKLGATVFPTWEDIVDVNPKMIMLLLAAIMQVAQQAQITAGK